MKRVAVSLGHYPDSPGAVYPKMPNSEYTLLAPVFGYLVAELQKREIGAYLVPSGLLGKKTAYINEGGFDFAIELHLNADIDSDTPGSPEAVGCETLYNTGSVLGKKFAELIQSSLATGLGLTSRGVVSRSDLIFLNRSKCPAVILEPAFIDDAPGVGSKDELGKVLSQPEKTASFIADAIAKGLSL